MARHFSVSEIDVLSTPVATMVMEQLSPEDRAQVQRALNALAIDPSNALVPLSSTGQNMDRFVRQHADKFPDAELFMVRAGSDLRLLVLMTKTKEQIMLVDVIRTKQLDYFAQ